MFSASFPQCIFDVVERGLRPPSMLNRVCRLHYPAAILEEVQVRRDWLRATVVSSTRSPLGMPKLENYPLLGKFAGLYIPPMVLK